MEKKITGLSDQEVIQRINEGKVNNVDNKITKSYKEIFINNTITFFNMINVSLLALLIFVGSYKNTLFILVIVINTIAGIYQEIKAKITLDRLKIIVSSKVDVIRNLSLIHIYPSTSIQLPLLITSSIIFNAKIIGIFNSNNCIVKYKFLSIFVASIILMIIDGFSRIKKSVETISSIVYGVNE